MIAVNYNSYNELYDYIASIEAAASSSKSIVDVLVADNTIEHPVPIDVTKLNLKSINVRSYLFKENLGYLGAATKVLELIGKNCTMDYDYVIISNVDLKLSNTFFQELANINSDNVGWIVPSIYRIADNSNENPFMISRPSKLKLQLLCALYSMPNMYKLYHKFHKQKRVSVNNNVSNTEKDIYAGMGSLIITTKSLLDKYYPYRFPAFMYGEELFFAELVRIAGLRTRFYPQIIANDICGVSTGKLNIKVKCKMMKSGISRMLKEYFN